MSRDRWPELCELVEKDDGLPVRDAHHWTEDKLYFWNGYIHMTTTAMVGSPKWPAGVFYVDLFGGPGVCTLKQSKKRMPGSSLIAAYAPKPFTKIIVCEKDRDLAEACEARLGTICDADRFVVLRGDCNELIEQVVGRIPDRALTVAFIDPTGLHAHFDTITTLSKRGRVDLLVLFADAYDIKRNVEIYRQNSESNLDRVLGPDSGWRKQWDQLDNWTGDKARKLFAEIYKSQLARHLGYKEFGEKTMRSASGPLYRLIYASKHKLGLKFWNEATKKYASGQKQLFH